MGRRVDLFSDDELAALLAEVAPETSIPGEEETPEEEIPEAPVESVTRPGDIWLIGDHRLICGDCRDYGVIERLIGGATANVVITSPPYASQRAYDPASGSPSSQPAVLRRNHRDARGWLGDHGSDG